jgi:Fungal specific transcription factor domain
LPETEYAGNYAKLIKPEVATSTIQDAGRVFYLAELSNMSVLIHDYHNPASKVHYQLPLDWEQQSLVSTGTDDIELEILRARGALTLPPKAVCDELVNAFFTWVAPIVPIINRRSFMKRYHDPNNPPSILLMQAILLAGSRVCPISTSMDPSTPSATLFYQRAKALHDADHEKDRVTTVQSLILLGWYWEDPSTVTKNVFYWNGLAISIAHGFGMHRSVENSELGTENKKLWKRIWWTLFTRDRSVAAALGRPCHIDMRDSDVEMITEKDLVEDNEEPNKTHAQFFLSYVRLSMVMDQIMVENYSTKAKTNVAVFTQCDQALSDWLSNVPREVRWEERPYEFWSCYLHCIFQTASCLLYRAYLPTSLLGTRKALRWSLAFQSAKVITSLAEELMEYDELQYTPPFM